MIRTETVTINERQFIRTYSDRGMMIHGGFPEADYDEAYDPIDSGRTYTETNIPIDADPKDAEALLARLEEIL